MEYQKIANLLTNTLDQTSKYRTKNWVEINDDSGGTYNTNKQIKFKTIMLKSSLCDCSGAYILVKGIITVADTSAADAAAVNPKGIRTLSANCLITFFLSGNPVFNNGPRRVPRNPPDCIILDNWVFNNLISIDELLAKALRRFASCLLVNSKSIFVPINCSFKTWF